MTFGQNLELIVRQCCCCQKWVAMRVDPEDVDRHVIGGVFVQHAFSDRRGRPYISAADREMWISGVCGTCYDLLCPHDPKEYC